MKKSRLWMGKLFVLLAVFIVIIACSNQSEEQEADNQSPASPTSSEDVPLEKPTISLAIHDHGATIPSSEGSLTDNRWTRWINENAPVQVEFVPIPRTKDTERYSTLLASGSAPDILVNYDSNFRNELYSSNQIMPLDELIEQHSTTYKNLLEENPIMRKFATKPDGKMYEFVRMQGLKTNTAWLIRKDWLDKLGLDMPQTTEELLEVARAFVQRDPNGTGVNDTYAIDLGNSRMYLNAIFGRSFNYYIFNEEDKLTRVFDRTEAATAFMKLLYDEGLVDPDFLTDTGGEQARADWVNGKLGIYSAGGNIRGSQYEIFRTLKTNHPEAEVVALIPPASEYGRYAANFNSPAGSVYVVNRRAKNPEAIMKFIDWLSEESTLLTLKYGIEGEHWTEGENGCPVPIDVEKNDLELYWNNTYTEPLFHSTIFGICGEYENSFDPNISLEKEFIELIRLQNAAFLSPDIPTAFQAHFMPALPQDLNMIQSNAQSTMNDLWLRGIVSGSSYTVEQARAEAENIWLASGGQQVDDWYREFYANHPDMVYRPNIDNYK